MKRIILIAVVLSIVFLSPVAFAAADEVGPFYVGVLGGYVMPQNMNVADNTGGGLTLDAPLKDGGLVGIKIGYIPPFANKYLATELEYNYFFNTDHDSDKTIAAVGGTLDGSIKIQAFFLNFKWRYPEGAFHPYIGIGPGYAWFQAGDVKASSETTPWSGDTGTKFCYQILAGLDYDITKNWGVGVGYKYFQIKPSIGGEIKADYDYKAHVITLGVNYAF